MEEKGTSGESAETRGHSPPCAGSGEGLLVGTGPSQSLLSYLEPWGDPGRWVHVCKPACAGPGGSLPCRNPAPHPKVRPPPRASSRSPAGQDVQDLGRTPSRGLALQDPHLHVPRHSLWSLPPALLHANPGWPCVWPRFTVPTSPPPSPPGMSRWAPERSLPFLVDKGCGHSGSTISTSSFLNRIIRENRGFPGGSDNKASAYNAGDPGQYLDQEDPLEKETATHSSTLAWKIPWMEEPGGLQSMGLQRVGHD